MALRRVPLDLTEGDLIAAKASTYHMPLPCTECAQVDQKLIREMVTSDDFSCSACQAVIDINSQEWRTRITEFVKTLGEISFGQKS